jgi:hypothetical protein
MMVALATSAADALADEASPASMTTTTQAAIEPVQLAPPPNRSPETTTLHQKILPNRPLLAVGGIVFAGAYVPTVALAAADKKDRSLYIPVAGPWLALVDQPADVGTTETVLTVCSGIVQGVGVITAAASLFIPEKIPAATIRAAGVQLNITPTSYGRGSAGVGATGTF